MTKEITRRDVIERHNEAVIIIGRTLLNLDVRLQLTVEERRNLFWRTIESLCLVASIKLNVTTCQLAEEMEAIAERCVTGERKPYD